MDIKAVVSDVSTIEADTLIVFAVQDQHEYAPSLSAVNAALGNVVDALMDSGEFTGKTGQTSVQHTRGALAVQRVLLVGLGEADGVNVDGLRRAAATGLKLARDLKAVQVAVALDGFGAVTVTQSAAAISEGGLLGLYYYHGQRTSDAPENKLESLSLLVAEGDADAAAAGIAEGTAFAEGALLARELVNLPPNLCTPSYLAQQAVKLGETHGLKVDVLDRGQMQALKMGALLAVAQGTDTPPKFIIMEHNAAKASELDTVVLVGKGVTFDTGGYSLKTRDGMIGMKGDMGGAAAVIGAMKIVAALDVPLHVVGLVPSSDNMISGKAYRPQEVITASNGKTIEIISTDAEGRMLLADALVYAKRYSPAAVVDIATLTGGAVVALGSAAAAMFAIDETLKTVLQSAADATSERVWHMPLFPEYDKAIESQTADIRNSGGRGGSACTAAAFLRNFVDYPAWAHVDMAGMMSDVEGNSYIPVKGGTGYGARLLAETTRQWLSKTEE